MCQKPGESTARVFLNENLETKIKEESSFLKHSTYLSNTSRSELKHRRTNKPKILITPVVGVERFLFDLIEVLLAQIFSEEVTDLGLFERTIWLLSLAKMG